MENASKALIIAGAILVAILLISVGILIIKSLRKPIDQVSQVSDSQAIQTFNSKFSNYAGNYQTADEVQSLIILVMASNASDPEHQVGFRFAVFDDVQGKYIPAWYRDLERPITDLIDLLNPNKTYKVEPLYTYKKESTGYYVKSKIINDIAAEQDLAVKINTDINYISVFEVIERTT